MPDHTPASEEVNGVRSGDEEDDKKDNATGFAERVAKSEFGAVSRSHIDTSDNGQNKGSNRCEMMGNESRLRGFVWHAIVAISHQS